MKSDTKRVKFSFHAMAPMMIHKGQRIVWGMRARYLLFSLAGIEEGQVAEKGRF